MITRRQLTDVGLTFRHQLDPDEVVLTADAMVRRGEVGPLASFLARQLAAGRLIVPRPRSDSARPPSLLALLGDFCALHSTEASSTREFRA